MKGTSPGAFAPTVFQRQASAAAYTAEQAVDAQRRLGVSVAVFLLADYAQRDAARSAMFRSVERQARIAGCGSVRLGGDA